MLLLTYIITFVFRLQFINSCQKTILLNLLKAGDQNRTKKLRHLKTDKTVLSLWMK